MHAIDDTEMENENENNVSGTLYNTSSGTIGLNIDNFSYNVDFEINNPSIDLDTYISGFTGLMRISRLVFLAEHCPTIRVDALKLAITYVLETFNTQLYTSIHKQLTEAFSRGYWKSFLLICITEFKLLFCSMNS